MSGVAMARELGKIVTTVVGPTETYVAHAWVADVVAPSWIVIANEIVRSVVPEADVEDAATRRVSLGALTGQCCVGAVMRTRVADALGLPLADRRRVAHLGRSYLRPRLSRLRTTFHTGADFRPCFWGSWMSAFVHALWHKPGY